MAKQIKPSISDKEVLRLFDHQHPGKRGKNEVGPKEDMKVVAKILLVSPKFGVMRFREKHIVSMRLRDPKKKDLFWNLGKVWEEKDASNSAN